MKHVLKFRWLIIATWIALAILLTVFTPDLQRLVAEKGQITVPDEYRSVEAEQMLEKMNDSDVRIHDLVLVFRKEEGLSENDQAEIVTIIKQLEEKDTELGLESVLNFAEDEDIAESTVSEDGTTIIVPIEATTEKMSILDLREEITGIADSTNIPHALTYEYVNEDDISSKYEVGLTKTIYITVILILIILFGVFRSVVAPVIPLLTIGISYLIAEGIVSILADTTAFPLSTFTQVFMVSIMFGIGTDYCILIISRFKEEMNLRETIPEAVIETYKASGKTIFYAALAVLIGFSTIGLSQFSLYQSAVAVAIGVFVVTVALVTIVPFFLVLLGRKLFWPFHKKAEHKESKLWGALGHFTWTRPVISLLIVAIIAVPVLLLYKGEQTYDNLAELSDDYDTVIGFNWIEEAFGPGEIMPITVVMELSEAIEEVADVQGLETITSYLADLDGIAKVRSVSRPAGAIVEDFLLEKQTDILTDGLEEMLDGVKELQEGLTEASDEMKEQAPELKKAQDGVQALVDGTGEVRDGILEVQSAIQEIEDGLREGAMGLDEAIAGLEQIRSSLNETIQGHRELLDGYKQITAGIQQAEKKMQDVADVDIDFDIEGMLHALDGIEQSIDGMIAITDGATKEINSHMPEGMKIPEITKIPKKYKEAAGAAKHIINEMRKGLEEAAGAAKHIINEMRKGLEEAAKDLGDFENVDLSFKEIIQPLEELNVGYSQLVHGQDEIASVLDELIDGLRELQQGLGEATEGQSQIANSMPEMSEGLGEIIDGQEEIKEAFNELHDGLDELADGLAEGADGLNELYDGLEDINRYLSEMDFTSQEEIVVIPKEALEDKEFWDAAELYLSPDRKIVKFEAVLDLHPYSKDALQLVDEVEEQVAHAIKKTRLDVKDFKIGGTSSINNDLDTISAKDYKRTATLMLIGIFLILVFMLRSLVMPLYILASLLLTYFTAIGLSEIIFTKIVGYEGLTWAIPFFSFVMLIALGVDYSIFLMSRFNEYRDSLIYDGMMKSMRNMGTVIISATLILGGTFAAMLPSGVLSLLQIASVVIIGLALYALIILPLLTPIFVKLFGKYNWWPFMDKKDNE